MCAQQAWEAALGAQMFHILLLQDVHSGRGIDVGVWMTALEKQMRIAMRETFRDALAALPSQVRLVAFAQGGIHWHSLHLLCCGCL
jgi:hypothetical protein